MYSRTKLHKNLLLMQDLNYRDFSSSLIPTLDKQKIIGVRTPHLRAFAKKYAKTSDAPRFLLDLPHTYLEENHLHAFIIETFCDFDKTISALNDFLPFIDNWATCDSMSPKILAKYPDRLLPFIRKWLKSEHIYQVRFALLCLMRYYLDDRFDKEYIELALSVKSDEYYIRMMIAWFFATALAKKYADALPYMQKGHLDTWTHNKAIQKACESNRITPEQKIFLKTLKRK